MTSADQHEITSRDADSFFTRRRILLQLAAAGVFGTMLPALAEAQQGPGEWEDGDPLCRQSYTELEKPAYELDAAFLTSFVGLSSALTGVAALDRNLASEYMERYARHPLLSATLKKMIDAYGQISSGGATPSEADVKKTFMPDSPSDDAAKQLNDGAKQLIYLWYVSAFFLPRADDPTGKIKVWVYGTPEQYRRGLLWSVIQAHAPMTPGGGRNHWASAPTA